MERLNLSAKTIKILPITYNSNDYDLEIDTKDVAVTAFLMKMADDCLNIDKEIKSVANSNDIPTLRKLALEALAKTEEFYKNFCDLVPNFESITEGKPIRDFTIWVQILSAVGELLADKKALEKVTGAINDEESETLE